MLFCMLTCPEDGYDCMDHILNDLFPQKQYEFIIDLMLLFMDSFNNRVYFQ